MKPISIKSALKKELGIKNSDVSVRGTTVCILNPAFSYQKIEEIAKRYEKIHRTEDGDISAGGNTFVSVVITSTARDILMQKYGDALNESFNNAPIGCYDDVLGVALIGKESETWCELRHRNHLFRPQTVFSGRDIAEILYRHGLIGV